MLLSFSYLQRKLFLSILFKIWLLKIGKSLMKNTDSLFGVVGTDVKSLKQWVQTRLMGKRGIMTCTT